MNKATLYGIGVGPGDPELMTLKAVRILKAADVIGIPVSERGGLADATGISTSERGISADATGTSASERGILADAAGTSASERGGLASDYGSTAFDIACRAVPELTQKESCRLVFPMTRNTEQRKKAFQTNAALLLSYLAAGKTVAFPVLGDPSIYSTYTYVSRLVAAAGYPTETVPGIPSFAAAAAAAGQSLGEDDMQIHIFPVLRSEEKGQTSAESSLSGSEDSSSLCSALSLPGRKILMKGGRFSGQVRDVLLEKNLSAVMVENCGMEGEKIYRSPEIFPDRAGYYSVILI
ncbi:MAG: precorrin-2 C(20)-methyltransferase [Lachnospiraceae bacterium]|nr:precorrin-2 C(20)-methyltransferase [Lachnospiraceae bacterium]